MRKTDIVVTTIFEPAWLDGYLTNVEMHGHKHETTIRIICDRKSPDSVYKAADAARDRGFNIDCPTLEEQENFLSRLGLDDTFIPWDTDNRRNIGFLRAWESGAEVLISIDDDNYCRADSDFVGAHQAVGAQASDASVDAYAAGGDWYNICRRLNAQITDPFFARGYPYAARRETAQAATSDLPLKASGRRIAVNAGLWLDDPDVDATGRLVQAPQVDTAAPGAVLLASNTWSPINTQNTALIRAAIPAYYYVRMGYPIQGLTIDRYGDILSGYFLQKCAKHLGDGIRFGDPVAEHHRSPHNLFKDLYHELAGMVIVEDLLPWLRELKLEGSDYRQTYASLADALARDAHRFTGFVWDEGGRSFLQETATCMRQWLKVIASLEGAGA